MFWQVGNDATIASGSSFVGTLIAGNDITVVSGATVNGRVLSINGALTTDNNTISGPTCTPAPATLKIVKVVDNGSSGTAVVSDFNLYVKSSGTNVSGSPAVGASSPGTSYSLSAGTYAVSEDANSSYTQSFSGACDSGGSVTLSSGDNVTCTITNTYITQATSSGSSGSSGSSTTTDPELTNTDTTTTTTTVETVPGLPVTGFEDKENNNSLNIVIAFGVLVLSISVIVLGRKKFKV